MDERFLRYVEAIPAAHRPLFDRVHRLLLEAAPDATPGFAYSMPAYRSGKRRLSVGVWQHGVSLYGWQADRDGGFTTRHADLVTGKGTIQLTKDAADQIFDDELRIFFQASLTI